jgi:hypothetical protein
MGIEQDGGELSWDGGGDGTPDSALCIVLNIFGTQFTQLSSQKFAEAPLTGTTGDLLAAWVGGGADRYILKKTFDQACLVDRGKGWCGRCHGGEA